MELNDIRVYDPRDYEYSPELDFDSLIDVEDTKKPEITRCCCDDSESDLYLTCSICGYKELENYGYRYKSSAYCNECAFKVCDKLIEKPKYAFTRLKEDKIKFINCHFCDYEMLWEDKIYRDGKILCSSCDYDTKLLNQYSKEQQTQLTIYAKTYNLTIDEAIDYQTHCHCCGKEVKDGVFDEVNHQYCKKRCFEYIEEYRYHCFKKDNCMLCGNNNYYESDDENLITTEDAGILDEDRNAQNIIGPISVRRLEDDEWDEIESYGEYYYLRKGFYRSVSSIPAPRPGYTSIQIGDQWYMYCI
jgi:hypothetical protein